MNRLRGKLTGLSGSSQAICRLPDFRPATTWSLTATPASSASAASVSGLVASCGADGSQPMRSARTLRSIMLPR